MAEGVIAKAEEDIKVAARGELGHSLEPAPGLLPGELRPHPTPFKYVLIAVILVVVTALEVGVSYMEGEIPNGLIVALLLIMAVVKFVLVASWYMHLRTDQPIFRRVFTIGAIGAIILYTIVLATLHAIV